MTDALARPLVGLDVGLSVSESDDSVHLGFPSWQVNHVTLQAASGLIGQGAGVVFGHDWREDGVMEAVHSFALRMQAPDGPPSAIPASPPLLRNLLPWPDKPSLTVDERARLASTLVIEEAGLPDDLAQGAARRITKGERTYLRARALTHLRRRLTDHTQARICLGGRMVGTQGRYPGVVEEAYLSVDAGQPLFLAGLLGGATKHVIDAIEGRPRPPGFGRRAPLEKLYARFASRYVRGPDAEIDPNHVWSRFNSLGVEGMSHRNGLADDENRELFDTPAVERAIQLILLGLARIKAAGDPKPPPRRPARSLRSVRD